MSDLSNEEVGVEDIIMCVTLFANQKKPTSTVVFFLGFQPHPHQNTSQARPRAPLSVSVTHTLACLRFYMFTAIASGRRNDVKARGARSFGMGG